MTDLVVLNISVPRPAPWEPLHAVAPEAWWGDFMFMGLAHVPDLAIALYKHLDTRHYLNIDETGQCYVFWHTDRGLGRYTAITREAALAVFAVWYRTWKGDPR